MHTQTLCVTPQTVRRAYPYGLPRGAWELVYLFFSSVPSVDIILTPRSHALRGNAYTDALRHTPQTVRRAYPYGLPRGAWEPVNLFFSSVFSVPSVVTVF